MQRNKSAKKLDEVAKILHKTYILTNVNIETGFMLLLNAHPRQFKFPEPIYNRYQKSRNGRWYNDGENQDTDTLMYLGFSFSYRRNRYRFFWEVKMEDTYYIGYNIIPSSKDSYWNYPGFSEETVKPGDKNYPLIK